MKLIILNVFVAEARTARKLVEQIWQSGQFGPTSGTLENFINLFCAFINSNRCNWTIQ